MRPRALLAGLLSLPLGLGTGCGTIFSGTSQRLSVSTTPAEARVSLYALDGAPVLVDAEVSGGAIEAPRPLQNRPHIVVVSAEGHCPVYSVEPADSTVGYMAEVTLLAIPFIQLIGFGLMSVDHATGGCCATRPVVVRLEAGPCE